MSASRPTGPLTGLRVYSMTQAVSGPFCCMLLADMGADVTKVERPFDYDARTHAFINLHRNQRSLAIDLKHPEARQAFYRLIAGADVFVENFRMSALKRLGIDYETLKEINPRLIYCAISGYGHTGPYADRGGYDLIAQGFTGIMSIIGHEGTPPSSAALPITDLATGMLAAFAILAAYVARERTGEGQFIDCSLVDSGLAISVWELGSYFATGQVPDRLGAMHRANAPYQAVKTADGYIVIGAQRNHHFAALCRLIGREDLLADERFSSSSKRAQHKHELGRYLEERFVQRTSAEWLAELEALDIPCGPLQNYAEALAHPQVQAREMVRTLEQPGKGTVNVVGIPFKLSATPGNIYRPAPAPGEHNDELLREAGLDDAAIARLREAGAIL
ncbi:MAG TPA: CoA transferase [Bacillota bacterium]